MRAWEAVRHVLGLPAFLGLPGLNTLSYGGGIDGIGVTSGTPKVYLVFYGSQWTSGGDPNGAATYLQNLFNGIGTGGGVWAGPPTPDCEGPPVPAGAPPPRPPPPPPLWGPPRPA